MSMIAMTGFDHDVFGSRFGMIVSFGRGRYLRFTDGNSCLDFNFYPAEYHNSVVTDFAWTQEVLEQSPITTAKWTQSDIDGLETGVEVRP